MKPAKNPKGGAPILVNAPQLDLNLPISGPSSKGSGGPNFNPIVVTKTTDPTSTSLFGKCS